MTADLMEFPKLPRHRGYAVWRVRASDQDDQEI